MLASLTRDKDEFVLKIPSAIMALLGMDSEEQVKITSDGSRLIISRPKSRAAANEVPERKNPNQPSMSCRDAAIRVLREEGRAMDRYEIAKIATEKGYWTSGGQTPEATIGAALYTEIKTHGEIHVKKDSRGKFKITDKEGNRL